MDEGPVCASRGGEGLSEPRGIHAVEGMRRGLFRVIIGHQSAAKLAEISRRLGGELKGQR